MPEPAAAGEEISTIAYTSGTTGKPKGARRDVKKVGLATVLNLLEVVPFRGSDIHLVACPLYHAAPMGMAHTSLILGASLVIMPRFDPEEFLRMIDQYKISTSVMVPTMIHDLIALPEETVKKYDVSSLRVILTTGAPLTLEQRADVRKYFGDVLYDMYGSTEWGWLSVATPRDHVDRPGTVGLVVPGNEIRVLDENRQAVAIGEIGELYGKTPMQVDEYHRNETATRESFFDGFVSVGDLVRQDSDGFIYLIDRKSDMVISGGVNLYPPEIEAVLRRHSGVADVAVLGIPDERMGETLLACVVKKQGADVSEDALLEITRNELSREKSPREFLFLDEIPHSTMGKVLKKELKERYLGAKGN